MQAFLYVYISLPSWHNFDVRMPNFNVSVVWWAKRQDNYFLFLFLNLDKVITIQLQKHLLKFDEQKEIEYASLRQREFIFGDVFVTIVSVACKP